MIHIIIDGKEAVLKSNISVEFVTENRKFSSSDSYSFNLDFPLKNCARNIEIFGLICNKQIMPKSMTYNCIIQDSAIQLKGALVITEYSDFEVKCQFLEGRSGSSITSPLADVYINEINIATVNHLKSANSPTQAWSASRPDGLVALPWVSQKSGEMHNKITFASDTYSWHNDVKGLSWQPYLTTVVKGICTAIGYKCDITSIEASKSLKYLLVCNTLPYSWGMDDVASALPHWTVEEFFRYLEKFLGGEFDVNHTLKSVTYRDAQAVSIDADSVIVTPVNDFTADVSASDTECKSIDISNLKYKEMSHSMQKFYDCRWLFELKNFKSFVIEFNTVGEMLKNASSWVKYQPGNHHRGQQYSNVYHVKDIDAYFCQRSIWKSDETYGSQGIKLQQMCLQRINEFAERHLSDKDDYPKEELLFVPACVMETDSEFWWTLFLDFDDESNSNEASIEDAVSLLTENNLNDVLTQPVPVQMIEAGEKSAKGQFFDCVFIGWWDGNIQEKGFNPFPNVSDTYISHDWNSSKHFDFSLRLDNLDKIKRNIRILDEKIKYNIKFLADSIPDVRSIFIIDGKKYVCEKLTMTLRKSGFSKLVKGVFWRIKD